MFEVAVEAGQARTRPGVHANRPQHGQGPGTVLARLQRTAGNAAVSSLFVQRLLGDADVVEIQRYIGEQIARFSLPDTTGMLAKQLCNAVMRSEDLAAARKSVDHMITLQVRKLKPTGTVTNAPAPTNPTPTVQPPPNPVPNLPVPDLTPPVVPPTTAVTAPAPGAWDATALRAYAVSEVSLTEQMADSGLLQKLLNAVGAVTDEAKDKATFDRVLRTYRARRSAASTAPATEDDSDEDTGSGVGYGGEKHEVLHGRKLKELTKKKDHYEPYRSSGSAKAKGLTMRELLGRARRARDELVGYYEGKWGAPAAVVGAVDVKTGKALAGESGTAPGWCAEDDAAAKLGCDSDDIMFTSAIRPRNGQDVPVCRKCQGNYRADQFEDGTNFD